MCAGWGAPWRGFRRSAQAPAALVALSVGIEGVTGGGWLIP
jgi:hypothetical protein